MTDPIRRAPIVAALLIPSLMPDLAGALAPIRSGDVELVIDADHGLEADARGGPWRPWLESTLEAARSVTGRFPRERVIIDLRSTGESTRAIAFGQIRRGRPPRIRFWVAPDADLEALRSDWRTYHEFAHLLIPFPGNRDIWFTEGLASYYQYLLQSRVGVIPERAAWEELLSGFERGRRDRAGRGRTLRELSPRMWRERAFKRVYWTGAAFFLRVDTRLRTHGNGEHSLDRALARFHECCLDADRRWNARELVERLGELSVASIWREEYQRTIDARAEPDAGPALHRLGIDTRRSSPRFSDAPAERALRRAIAGPRDGGPYRPDSEAP